MRGDTTRLATMIANAISNGLKFGDNVTIVLSVTGAHVMLHIDDDGPGMTATDRERVF